MGAPKKTNNTNKKVKPKKKSAITLYWEKMGDKRGQIFDMKAVLK